MADCILKVRNLSIEFSTSNSHAQVIKNVTFEVDRGSVFALVGESGSGKTTLCRALTGLFPPQSGVKPRGDIIFESTNLATCSDEALNKIRQKAIRYVFQEPYLALNPLASVARQMMAAKGNRDVHREEIPDLLNALGLTQTEKILRSYPHELSVGMAQRVMIAMALLPQPSVLIADEPTSALDASLRKQLLDSLETITKQRGMTMILITHDLAVAKRYSDEIAVLKDGAIVETCRTEDFFLRAQHPYSRLLIESMQDRAHRQRSAVHNGTNA